MGRIPVGGGGCHCLDTDPAGGIAMMSTRFLVGALVILTLILVVTLGIAWSLS